MRPFKRPRFVSETSNTSYAAPSESKHREIYLNSKDRNTTSSLYEARFFMPTALKGVSELSVTSFTYYNTFKNIKAPTNYIGFVATGIEFTTTFEPGFWICGLGTVTIDEVKAAPTTHLNDVRWEMLRTSIGTDLIASITLNPVNNKIIITFTQSDTADIVNVIDETVNLGIGVVTIPGRNAGTVNATGLINLSTNSIIQICSPTFDAKFNGSSSKTTGSSTFAIVNSTKSFGYRETFEPNQPITVRYPTSLKSSKNLVIQLRDENGDLLTDLDQNWSLVLRVRSFT